jgi:hypothetical protein
VAIADTAARYAPLVVLHHEEKLLPCSTDWFLARSSLRWATGAGLGGAPVPEAGDKVDADRLGAASKNPYSFDGHPASQLTRPLDDNPTRGTDPPAAQGFFLRLREEQFARGDKGTSSDPSAYEGVPVYWDYDEAARALTYWFCYAGSAPPLGLLRMTEQIGLRSREAGGVPAGEAAPPELEAATAAAYLVEFRQAYPSLAREVEQPATRGLTDVVQTLATAAGGVKALLSPDGVMHEGDWERMTVYLDKANPEGAPPESVAFYRHSTNTFRKWDSVAKEEGTHPIGYSAIGSHATLPTPGFGQIDVGDPHGPRWRTWENLASVVEEPWHGFGGAWGRLGKVRDATGPLGPGPHWKHAAPRPATPA